MAKRSPRGAMVARLRKQGMSFAAIGLELGITRQAASRAFRYVPRGKPGRPMKAKVA